MNATVAMKLLLEDGTEMSGRAFGAAGSVGGEVVFNTAMTGYVEALTDPSYRGQILVLTYPLVGSYGVPAPRAPGSLDGPYESCRVQVQGLVVQCYVSKYSHYAATRSLGAWLEAEGVPGITGIEPRAERAGSGMVAVLVHVGLHHQPLHLDAARLVGAVQ